MTPTVQAPELTSTPDTGTASPTPNPPPLVATAIPVPEPPTVTPTLKVLPTATPTVLTPPIPTPAPTPPPPAALKRPCIFFDGVVPTSESDEYVEITNTGGSGEDIGGWTLKDIADGTPTFQFPSVILKAGASIRVYTNEVYPESGGFSFGRGTSIWNNSTPDETGLYVISGTLVSRKSYPPGW